MRVTILGCGGSAGVPHIGGLDGLGDWGACDPTEPRNRRTRSSIVIEGGGGERLLVDTSPDMRNQLLACSVPRIDAIFFTHAHADHITGLDDVRILNRIIGRPIQAIGTQRTLDELAQRFDYAFRPWQPPWFFRPVLENRPIVYGETVEAAGLSIEVFEQDHGYMPTAGMRIGGFGYSTDVVGLTDAAFDVLAGVDVWVVDCFQRQPHKTHVNLEQVLTWAKRVGAKRTILTHMGPDMDWQWLQKRLPCGVEPGVDGLVLDLPNA